MKQEIVTSGLETAREQPSSSAERKLNFKGKSQALAIIGVYLYGLPTLTFFLSLWTAINFQSTSSSPEDVSLFENMRPGADILVNTVALYHQLSGTPVWSLCGFLFVLWGLYGSKMRQQWYFSHVLAFSLFWILTMHWEVALMGALVAFLYLRKQVEFRDQEKKHRSFLLTFGK